MENLHLHELIEEDKNKKKIIFVDTSAYIHRYYSSYIKKQIRYNGEVLEIGALIGILEFTNRLKNEFNNANIEIIHVLDPDSGSHYRKSLHPEYKLRKEKDFELTQQIKLLPLILAGYNQKFIKIDGIESDDILAKYAKMYGENDLVILMAEDKDVWQNIVDEREDGKSGIVSACRYSKNSNGFNQFDLIFSDFVVDKFGIKPYQLADYLALNGDKSDNIPGVKGIGAVAAKKLLVEYGNISNIINAAESGELDVKYSKKILSGKEDLLFSKSLTIPFLDFEAPKVEDIKRNESYEIKYEAQKIVEPNSKWNFF